MTKDMTVGYAIDNLMDKGYFTQVINGHTHDTFSERARIDLEETYDEMARQGFVTAERLAARYVQKMNERKPQAKKGSKKNRK